MARFTEFADILVSKIRADERRGFPSANVVSQSEFDSDPAHLSYLLGQMHAQKNQTPSRNPYAKMVPEPRPHVLSENQKNALSQWQSWGLTLRPGFREFELKKGFRALAKRLHPDVSGGSGAAFIALKESYKELSTLFA